MAVGGAVQSSYHLINAFWVGRLGADAIAVVSVSFPVNLLLISLGSGLSLASTILIAQFHGARDRGQVNHIVAQSLTTQCVLSLSLALLGYLAAPWILRAIGAGEGIFDDALAYLRVALFGTVFLFVSVLYQAILRGIGEARAPMRVIVASVGINALLDPLLIFGWGPVTGLGVMGAAWATVLTQGITAATGIWLMFRPRFGLTVDWPDLRPRRATIGRMLKLGFPASLEQSMQALTVSAMTVLAAKFGTVVLAAYGLAFRLLTFTIIPVFSVSMATSILVGQRMGAGDHDRARATTYRSAALSFAMMLVIGSLLSVFAPFILGLFVPEDPALIRQGAAVLQILTLAYPLTGLQLAFNGAFRGAGDTFTAMLLTLCGIWLVQLPAAYVLSQHSPLGSDGLWWSNVVATCTTATVALVYFRSNRWLRKARSEEEGMPRSSPVPPGASSRGGTPHA